MDSSESAAAAPPVAGPTLAPPPTAPSPGETGLVPHSHLRRRAAVGTAVAAVAIVALLLLTGIIPLFVTPTSTGIPYSEAEPKAASAVPAGYGPFPLVLGATAVDSRPGAVFSAARFTNNTTASCTVTHLAGYPASGNLSVPAFSGGFDSGVSPFWVFVFTAGASGPYAVVAVVDEAAVPLAVLSGTNCPTIFSGARPLPAQLADSPQAATAAWGAGGGSVYVNHTANASTLTMTAFGGAPSGILTVPVWLFLYSACAPIAGGTVATPAWVAAVNLTTTSFVGRAGISVNCPA